MFSTIVGLSLAQHLVLIYAHEFVLWMTALTAEFRVCLDVCLTWLGTKEKKRMCVCGGVDVLCLKNKK